MEKQGFKLFCKIYFSPLGATSSYMPGHILTVSHIVIVFNWTAAVLVEASSRPRWRLTSSHSCAVKLVKDSLAVSCERCVFQPLRKSLGKVDLCAGTGVGRKGLKLWGQGHSVAAHLIFPSSTFICRQTPPPAAVTSAPTHPCASLHHHAPVHMQMGAAAAHLRASH